MSNIQLIIEERAVTIGKFMVGRLLPFRQKRMVGPFIYIDHMGPVELSSTEHFDIGPHPHIGLSTLTFLLEGSIMHRDSIGTVQEIKPGEVNWMTAGKGIAHSERTPDYLRNTTKRMHGLQIWVALPKHLEQMNPQFTHVKKEDIPTWQDENGVQYRLVAGKLCERQSPVPVHSALYMLEVKSATWQQIDLSNMLYGEAGLYILQGSITTDEHTYGERQILVAHNASLCNFTIEAGGQLYIFGGEPFAEERHIDWNFVSSDKEHIAAAKAKWQEGTFAHIEGEHDAIPYPTNRK
jgi:redox-sensitive bicupin YhaK (pirin superfamily)